MLKTCLKHDLRALMRLWWIVGAVIVGVSFVISLCARLFSEAVISGTENTVFILAGISAMFVVFVGFMALAFMTTLTTILIYWRMYTHFFTDQGYLTFTLPVKRSTLYLSKVLAGLIMDASTFGAYLIGILMFLLIGLPPEAYGETTFFGMLGAFFGVIGSAFAEAGVWVVLWVLLAILLLVALELLNSATIYFCITLGAVIVKKHKLLAGIGVYYGSSVIASVVGQILYFFCVPGLILLTGLAMTASGFHIMALTVTAALLVLFFLLACTAALIHLITMSLLERRLNLA